MSLSTGDTKESLSFSQGGADTIMLSVYAALRSISPGYSNLIVIDAEGTDVYIQAAAISHDIPGIIIPLRSNFFSAEACVLNILPNLLYLFVSCLAVMPTAVFLGTAKYPSMRNCQKVLRPVASSQSVEKAFC